MYEHTAHSSQVEDAFTKTQVRLQVRVSVSGLYKLHSYEWRTHGHLYKHITQHRSSAIQFGKPVLKKLTTFY